MICLFLLYSKLKSEGTILKTALSVGKSPFTAYHKALASLLSLTALGYLLYHTLAGGTLLSANSYDSYALQAQNWLNGHIDISNGSSYSWLELAIFQGKYYVSFPPVPSLVSLPFVALMGMSPANLLIAVYSLFSCGAVFQCIRHLGGNPQACVFWAVFFTFATNLTELSRNGGVWNQAQALNLTLCFLAMWCLFSNRNNLCLLLLALAVGCRPFSAVYLLAAGIYFLWQGRSKLHSTLFSLLPGIFSVLLVAFCMMAYNTARFGNPLEFGHNYLPEFTRSEYGQFHLSYLLPNLLQLFRLPTLNQQLMVEFPLFNGFLFFLVNPIFAVWGIHLFRQWKQPEFYQTLCFSLLPFLLVLLALCAHKTMGGWQFGARYTLDLLPAVLAGIGFFQISKRSPHFWEQYLCTAGVIINIFGMIFMLLQESAS